MRFIYILSLHTLACKDWFNIGHFPYSQFIMKKAHQLYKSFKSQETPLKAKVTSVQDALMTVSGVQNQKKFFDIDYIFEDRLATRKHRRYLNERPAISKTCDRKYKTIDEKIADCESIVFKTDGNLFKMEPVKEKQCYHFQTNTLHFAKDEKTDSIHAKRINTNSALIKSWSNKKTQRSSSNERKPFEEMLTSKHFSVNRQIRSAEKQRRRFKVERLIKKLDSSEAMELSKDMKKMSKLQGDEFRKYCQRNVQFAKNAFLLKNKQTIRIYRPWSPVLIDQGFMEYDFAQLS